MVRCDDSGVRRRGGAARSSSRSRETLARGDEASSEASPPADEASSEAPRPSARPKSGQEDRRSDLFADVAHALGDHGVHVIVSERVQHVLSIALESDQA